MIKFVSIIILLSFLLLPFSGIVSAQSAGEATYIVQSGDTVNIIALRFGISAADLINANNLADPNVLNIGTELIIPGLDGFSGTLTTDVAGLGATLAGLSRQYQIPVNLLVKLNRITSPAEIYVGSTLVLPSLDEGNLHPTAPINLGDSVLETAAKQNINPWTLIESNGASSSPLLLPVERLYSPADPGNASVLGSELVQSIEISPLPIRQGKTEVITVKTNGASAVTGELNGKELHFFPLSQDEYAAIQGVYALAPVGLANINIQVIGAESTSYQLDQSVLIESGYYPQDPPLYVDPTTIDESQTRPEDDQIQAIVTPSGEERYWNGNFKQPVDDPVCIKSWFGNRRSYNGSEYNYFHAGVDYGVCNNLNIYAPAPGRVVYSQQVTVRGVATIIDHGWGIYTGYWHQSQSLVKVGDFVETGQLIGEIGKTGRVTGPHLHWEVWANGVQVEPLDWLDSAFPEDFLPPA